MVHDFNFVGIASLNATHSERQALLMSMFRILPRSLSEPPNAKNPDLAVGVSHIALSSPTLFAAMRLEELESPTF
jgi:hypothetical protein